MMEIRLSNVGKYFPGNEKGDRVAVLSGINEVFQGGRLYVIKGISGSGKTTLLNLIGGIDKNYEGTIEYSDKRLKKAAYMFQESLLLSGLTVQENLDLIFPDSPDITLLSERLGVSELLARKTEDLSGGERQRIALIRALLLGSPLILADEPTASLDEDNSERVAEMLASLKDPERIILVATHEHYFDEIADQILDLKYGVIEKIADRSENEDVSETGKSPSEEVTSEAVIQRTTELSENASKRLHHRSLLERIKARIRGGRYILKRRKKSFSFGALLPLLLVLTLPLIVSSFQQNLSTELIREYRKKYPMDIIELSSGRVEELLSYEGTAAYYDYRIKDDAFTVYPLMPPEYSCFSLPKMIEYGSFPLEKDEVLLSQVAAGSLQGKDPESLIGKEILIGGETYRVKGITGDIINSRLASNRLMDVFYLTPFSENAVFVPYETAKEKGTIKENAYSSVQCIWPGVSQDDEKMKIAARLKGSVNLSRYYWEIDKIQKEVDLYAAYFDFVLILIFIASGIFIISLVHVDLFYRRRELGYLQIFGMKKARVVGMLAGEYLMKYLFSFGLSLICYGLIFAAASGIRGRLLFPNWSVCAILESILFLIHMFSVSLGILTFLRKSPVELIGRA